jgi:hypothetical protein
MGQSMNLASLVDDLEKQLSQKPEQVSVNLPLGSKKLTISGDVDYENGYNTLGLATPGVSAGDVLAYLGMLDVLTKYNITALLDIESIELAAVEVGYSADPFALVSFSFALKTPELRMVSVSIQSPTLTFGLISPLSSPMTTIFITGAIDCGPVSLSLGLEFPDLSFTASMNDGDTIDLLSLSTSLFKTAPALPKGFPSVTAAYATVQGDVSAKKISFTCAATATWKLPCSASPLNLDFQSVTLQYQEGGNPSLSGEVDVKASFAGVDLAGQFDLPGDFSLTGSFREVSLKALMTGLSSRIPWIPLLPDVVLKQVAVNISEAGGQFRFNVGVDVQGFGVLLGSYHAGLSSLVLGFSLPDDWKLSSLPGFPRGFDELAFKQAILIFATSSFETIDEALPSSSDFKAPSFPETRLQLPSGFPGVVDGVTFYASLDLQAGALSRLSKLLNNVNAAIDVAAEISLDPETALFKGNLAGSVSLVAGRSGGLFLSNPQLLLGLQDGNIMIGVAGTMTITVRGSALAFSGELEFEENEGLFAGTLAQWDHAFGVRNMSATDLSLDVGFSYEGLPSIGLAGIFTLGTFNGGFAIRFDSGNPANSMFAGTISETSAADIVRLFAPDCKVPFQVSAPLEKVALSGISTFTLAGAFAAALNDEDPTADLIQALNAKGCGFSPDLSKTVINTERAGTIWFVTDLENLKTYRLTMSGADITASEEVQVYLVPQDTTVGASLTFKKGYYFEGRLQVFGASGSVNAEMDPDQGLSLDAVVSPFSIAKVLTMKASTGKGGPLFSLSTYDCPSSRYRGPHLVVSGRATIAGVLAEDLAISATATGFSFQCTTQIFDLVKATLNATASTADLASADFDLAVEIDGSELSQYTLKAAQSLKSAADNVASSFGDANSRLEKARDKVESIKGDISANQKKIDDNNRQIDDLKRDYKKHPGHFFKDSAKIAKLGLENAGYETAKTAEEGSLKTAQGVLDAAEDTLSGIKTALNTGLNDVSTWLKSNPVEKLIVLKKASFSTALSAFHGAKFSVTFDASFQGKDIPSFTLTVDFDKNNISRLADDLADHFKDYLSKG